MFYWLVFLIYSVFIVFTTSRNYAKPWEYKNIQNIPTHMEITVYILYDIIDVNLKKGVLIRMLI